MFSNTALLALPILNYVAGLWGVQLVVCGQIKGGPQGHAGKGARLDWVWRLETRRHLRNITSIEIRKLLSNSFWSSRAINSKCQSLSLLFRAFCCSCLILFTADCLCIPGQLELPPCCSHVPTFASKISRRHLCIPSYPALWYL